MRAREFLLEYDQSKTLENWGMKLAAAWVREIRGIRPGMNPRMEFGEQKLAQLEEIDPTPHNEYVQWLCKIYASQTVKMEDLLSRGADALARYNRLKLKKQLAPEHRDINRFKTFTEFEDVVRSYPEVEASPKEKGVAEEYYSDETMRIIIPKDVAAAKYYGQGTKWCTAAKNNNMFEEYNSEGPLYIILPKQPITPGEKYQLHFETGQYMDVLDKSVSVDKLVNRFPGTRNAFAQQARRFLVIGMLDNPDKLRATFEQFKMNYRDIIDAAINPNPKNESFWKNINLSISSGGDIHIREAVLVSKGLQQDYNEFGGMLVRGILERLTADNVGNADLLDDAIQNAVNVWLNMADNYEAAHSQYQDFNRANANWDIGRSFINRLKGRVLPQLRTQFSKYIK